MPKAKTKKTSKKETEPKEKPKVEVKASQRDIDKAKDLTEYDKKQIANVSMPRPLGFGIVIVELRGGRTVMINKRNQVISPVAVTAKEQSDLRRVCRDMNMKDPEQKIENQTLKDTPQFAVTGERSGKVANPVVVPESNLGNAN